MRPHQVLAGQLIDCRGQPLRQSPRVDKDDGRAVLAYQLQDPWMDRRPDTSAGAVGLGADPRRRTALREGQGGGLALEIRHILDRDLDRDLHWLDPAGVDDGDLAVGAAKKACGFGQWALGRRQPDALQLRPRDSSQSFKAEGEVRAPLGLRHRVDLVDDHPPDAGQDLPRRAGQEQEKRLGRGDQDVGRVAFDLPAIPRRCVAGPDGHRDWRQGGPQTLGLQTDAAQGCLQVALDVDGERLERRNIQHATAFSLGRDRFGRQPIDAPEEGRQRLAAAGRCRHQRVLAGRHRSPAAILDLGGGRKRSRKPGARRRRKQVQNGGHGSQFIDLVAPVKT